jgi:hypothetical protein
MTLENPSKTPYDQLLNKISQRYVKGQSATIQAVNESIIDTNWDSGSDN